MSPPPFAVAVDDLRIVGEGINRRSAGDVRHVIGVGEPRRAYVPNGIALAPDGRVLLADLGAPHWHRQLRAS